MTRTSALIALALLLAGCASTDGDGAAAPDGATAAEEVVDVEVRPFGEIQDSELVFEADPGDPRRGIFRVTTTEATICAIVWGDTDELGRFNNSLAMSGTGIVQHDVVLPDIEQGREYRFLVQGTTADGTLFRSEIEFNDSFAVTNAIDDDLSTEWSSREDGDGAFITLDLGAATDITGEVLGPFPAGTPAQARISEIQATATTLTFEVVRSSSGNVGAVEIQVFGG